MARLTFKVANRMIQEKYPHVVVRQGEGYVYVSTDFEDAATDFKSCRYVPDKSGRL